MSESAMDVVEIMARAIALAEYRNIPWPEGWGPPAQGYVRAKVAAALRAADEAGFVLVPKEATEEMRAAAAAEYCSRNTASYIWSAMIAASVKGGGT